MVTDGVADALIRIKNGYLSQKEEVILPYSKLVLAISKLLEKEDYVGTVKEINDEKKPSFKLIKISLKYEGKKAAVSDVRRISKPGLRVYKGSRKLPWVLNGIGIAIISTPKGVMTDKQARKEKLGGEIMAYVW